MEQELRAADGKLYGVLRDGRWLEFRHGERAVQFDLAVFAMVDAGIQVSTVAADLRLEESFSTQISVDTLHFIGFFDSVERIRSTESTNVG